MIRNLPYTALRSFEAVARLRSFSRAADELGITQSAVSQHVKALEEWTSCQLVRRGKTGSQPTPDGEMLADAVANGLGQISALCSQLQGRTRGTLPINVSCLPGFAVNWLFPRLLRFDQDNPSVPVSINTATKNAESLDGDADIAIRYGLGTYRGLHVEKLLGETLTPVCAPALLEHGPPLRSAADLAEHTLLIDDIEDVGGEPPTWAYWAERTGVVLPNSVKTRRFGQSNMVVQAAVEGYGVALGREPLVMDAIRDGRLVRPLLGVVESQYCYWFLCRKAALRSDRIVVFRNWIMGEARQASRQET